MTATINPRTPTVSNHRVRTGDFWGSRPAVIQSTNYELRRVASNDAETQRSLLVRLTALALSCAATAARLREQRHAGCRFDEYDLQPACRRAGTVRPRRLGRRTEAGPRQLQRLVRRRIEIRSSARVCELPKVSHAKETHTKFRGTASLSTSRTVADAERAASDASSGASPPRRSV